MEKPLIAAFAITLAATAALARTVSLDSIDGTAATVTVGPGDAGETLRLAYGKVDGGDDFSAWDTVSPILANVPAEGGTFNVTLPIDPLESLDSLVWRIVTAPSWNVILDALYGNGNTYFDTGVTNTSADTVVFDFTQVRANGSGATYNLLYGCRDSAFAKNISLMARRESGNHVFDFVDTDDTSGTVPGRVNFNDSFWPGVFAETYGYPAHWTVTNSAAIRFCQVEGSISSTNLYNGDATFTSPFECESSALIFNMAGSPSSSGYVAGSEVAFHSCRIIRGGETIADMVPVLSDTGADRIYDRIRNCYLEKRGTIMAFGIGATNSFAQITGTTEAFHRSSTREITVRRGSNGKLKVTVAAGESHGSLVMAYGASDAGGTLSDWGDYDVVAQFGSASQSVEVDFPAGWGDTVTALRFFAVQIDSYITSSGTQYIDTCWTNGSNHVVEMVFLPLNPLPDNARAFYGCRNAADSRNIVMFVDNNKFYCDFNSSDYNAYRVKADRSTSYHYRMVDSAARRIVELSQAGVVKSAITNATQCADTFTCAGSAYLFAANDMSSGSPAVLWESNGLPSIRFYSLRVWTTGGTLVSEILPVKVGGVAKAYDTVRDRYFENAGSGDFTYGMTVQSPFCVGDLITPQTKFGAGFMVIVR